MNPFKHIFHFSFFALLFLPVMLQTSMGESDGEIPKKLERKFKRDAARLALRMQASVDELHTLDVSISENTIDSIYQLLKDIYIKNETAKTIAKCKIHTFPNPSIDHFKLIFKNDVDWAASLQEDMSDVSNERMSSLLDDYDLFIDRHEKWTSEEDVIIIRSLRPMNMAALADKFMEIEGVESIDLGIPEIKGNDITIERKGNSWILSYILSVGDVFGQQTTNHVWTFKVNDNGNGVNLLREEGPPIPEWLKCDLSLNKGRFF